MNVTKRSLGTIGKCIYCGNSESSLSEEHVVPLGLGGIWTLQQATCQRCQNTTSAIERHVLRETLLAVRVKMNLPTRHKDNRPAQFPLIVERKRQKESISVPITERPTVLILPRFKLPAFVENRPREKGIILNGIYIYQFTNPSFQKFGKELAVDSVEETITYRGFKGSFSFARLLAKIAYGFAVTHFGVDITADNYLLPSILGKEDTIGKWVGSTDRQLSLSGNLHEVNLSVKDGDIYGYIRLFANLKGLRPEYVVVIGRAPQIQASISTDIQFNC